MPWRRRGHRTLWLAKLSSHDSPPSWAKKGLGAQKVEQPEFQRDGAAGPGGREAQEQQVADAKKQAEGWRMSAREARPWGWAGRQDVVSAVLNSGTLFPRVAPCAGLPGAPD